MKKQVSSPYTQLTLNFECESTSTAPAQQPKRVECSFSQTSFDEWQAIERDILSGRGAYLCEQNERHYAHERQLEKSLQQFAAVRASIYQ